ncbi:MAG: YfhL family 4Fe-4S dicluster ferredoxin [Chloroflexi bacterium]|nr:YfhL family 4Fe-4S dicluster ferredoxin [Chloroflexota bacterium]
MAYKITDDCINCSACEAACPNQAISEGESTFVVDPDKCTECKGFHDEPQCAYVCAVEAAVPDPDRVETEEKLLAKASRNKA